MEFAFVRFKLSLGDTTKDIETIYIIKEKIAAVDDKFVTIKPNVVTRQEVKRFYDDLDPSYWGILTKEKGGKEVFLMKAFLIAMGRREFAPVLSNVTDI